MKKNSSLMFLVFVLFLLTLCTFVSNIILKCNKSHKNWNSDLHLCISLLTYKIRKINTWKQPFRRKTAAINVTESLVNCQWTQNTVLGQLNIVSFLAIAVSAARAPPERRLHDAWATRHCARDDLMPSLCGAEYKLPRKYRNSTQMPQNRNTSHSTNRHAWRVWGLCCCCFNTSNNMYLPR